MCSTNPLPLTRRELLQRAGAGFGALGLASILGSEAFADEAAASANPLSPKAPHFRARAKRVIFLFMNGGPSHVDTFDPKPSLAKYAGQSPDSIKIGDKKNPGKLMASPFTFKPYGKSGIEVTEIYPEVASCIDDICVIRSMYTDNPNHE